MKFKLLPFFLGITVLFMSSCAEMIKSIATQMAEKNCAVNAPQPAGPDKNVLIFAKNHIHVAGDGGQYNPNGTTLHDLSKRKWKNIDLVNFRAGQIVKSFAEVNRVFQLNGVNVHVYHSGYDIQVVAQDNITADLDNYGVRSAMWDLIKGIQAATPQYINVYWLLGSTSAVQAVGVSSFGESFIVVGDDPPANSTKPLVFAHEMVHALGYGTHVFGDPQNLMNDGSIGDKLNAEQREMIWNNLNRTNLKLLNLSCDK